jgi:hypothetical protein
MRGWCITIIWWAEKYMRKGLYSISSSSRCLKIKRTNCLKRVHIIRCLNLSNSWLYVHQKHEWLTATQYQGRFFELSFLPWLRNINSDLAYFNKYNFLSVEANLEDLNFVDLNEIFLKKISHQLCQLSHKLLDNEWVSMPWVNNWSDRITLSGPSQTLIIKETKINVSFTML